MVSLPLMFNPCMHLLRQLCSIAACHMRHATHGQAGRCASLQRLSAWPQHPHTPNSTPSIPFLPTHLRPTSHHPSHMPYPGWGVYGSKDVCCAPNVAFPEGCSPEPDSATPAAVAAATAVPAAAARVPAGAAAAAAGAATRQAVGTAAPRVTAQSKEKLLGKR